MRLYATTTSERASKGQGGNKFLEIEIKAEKLEGIPTRANIYRLSLNIEENRLNVQLLDYSTGKIIILTKGEKQKGEKVFCKRCNRWYSSDELDPCDIPF